MPGEVFSYNELIGDCSLASGYKESTIYLNGKLSTGVGGKHQIQGIGAGFVPAILDRDVIDEIMTVSNEDAFENGRLVGKLEGFLVGISSGAALTAAIKLAKEDKNKNKNIVLVFPDSGDRYLSTKLYE